MIEDQEEVNTEHYFLDDEEEDTNTNNVMGASPNDLRHEVCPTVPTEDNGDLGQSTDDTIDIVAIDTNVNIDTQVCIDGNKMNTGTKTSNDNHPEQKSDYDADRSQTMMRSTLSLGT